MKYYLRKCDVCNKGMSSGIYAEGSGSEYFCSETCIKKDWDSFNYSNPFFITPEGKKLIYSEFIEWIDEQDDNTLDAYVWDWFNGCAEWYYDDHHEVVYDKNGKEYEIYSIKQHEIIEGDK